MTITPEQLQAALDVPVDWCGETNIRNFLRDILIMVWEGRDHFWQKDWEYHLLIPLAQNNLIECSYDSWSGVEFDEKQLADGKAFIAAMIAEVFKK